ncbi:MAG: FecR family protein [Mucilaginibacter sp.]|nr:FecR family protein [Mucilaginibacter sp.]
MENQLDIADLFVKYLESGCTPEEIKRLLRYFDIVENEEVLRALINTELEFTEIDKRDHPNIDTVIATTRSNLIKDLTQSRELSTTKNSRLYKWAKICAVWFLIIGAGGLMINYFQWEIKKAIHPVKFYTINTKQGERKTLVLVDGTKIWLSPSSSLEYPDQLKGNLREVKLEGEAFFEVAKDKKHPFVVHSGRMDTRVVGTSFNIQSFKAQTNSTVTVVTGIVKVTAKGLSNVGPQTVVLKPNHQSQFNKINGSLISINYPNASQMLSRKDGILNYDGAPVQDVVGDFSRYYKIPIEIESKSKNCLCYGEFNTNRPVNIVLEQLAAAINAKVVIKKDKYILKGGCEE